MLATAVAALSFAAPPAARLGFRRAVATMRAWGVEAGRLDDAEAQDLLDEAQAESSEAALYCLNVKLCIKPEVREEFLDCIRANQRGTLSSEPLAVTYVFGEDESTPNTFHFFEQYRGVEGFEAHTKSPHFADWETFAHIALRLLCLRLPRRNPPRPSRSPSRPSSRSIPRTRRAGRASRRRAPVRSSASTLRCT